MIDDLLLAAVERHLAPLLQQYGLTLSEYHYSPKHFGNASMEFTSERFRMRIIRERNDLFCEVGSLTSKYKIYYDLRHIYSYLDNSNAPYDVSGSAEEKVMRVAQILSQHGSEIFNEALLVNKEGEIADYEGAQKQEAMRAMGIPQPPIDLKEKPKKAGMGDIIDTIFGG